MNFLPLIILGQIVGTNCFALTKNRINNHLLTPNYE